ncbi:MAG: hypothetical protein COB04_02610 [Gammaproteobacteria bacterium]|nr:MAG: hypothetical protein COB04_02610 [Gammaproteobacteria bacterium]
MNTFRWVHFTDFHWGAMSQDQYWPSIKRALREDLARLHTILGGKPWDAVFFTGDLTNRGTKKEFLALNQRLKELQAIFAEFGSTPDLFVVPGNHDLVRPSKAVREKAAYKALVANGLNDSSIRDGMFAKAKSNEYFKIVNNAFKHYQDWHKKDFYFQSPEIKEGKMPGDFSYSFEKGRNKIGIVGINTAFLQLEGGDQKGRLSVDRRQWIAACQEDYAAWYDNHDLSIVLTHHPVDWLDEEGRETFSEMTPTGNVALHLCGHMHTNRAENLQVGGASGVRRVIQASSLFSHESYEEHRGSQVETKTDRRHGYSVGMIEFEEGQAKIRHWPREGVKKQDSAFSFERDRFFHLEDDDGVSSSVMGLKGKPPKTNTDSSSESEPESEAEGETGYIADSESVNEAPQQRTTFATSIKEKVTEILKEPNAEPLLNALNKQLKIKRRESLSYAKGDVFDVLVDEPILNTLVLIREATESYLNASLSHDEKIINWEAAVDVVCWLLLLVVDEDEALRLSKQFINKSSALQIELPVSTEGGVQIISSRVGQSAVSLDYNTEKKAIIYQGQMESLSEDGFTTGDTLYAITKLIWTISYPEQKEADIPRDFSQNDYAKLNARIKYRKDLRQSHYISLPINETGQHPITRELSTQLLGKDYLPDLKIFYYGVLQSGNLFVFGDGPDGTGTEHDLLERIEGFLELKLKLVKDETNA